MVESLVARARALGRAELMELWQVIQAGSAGDWPPGNALEHLILRAFEIEGAEVTRPYPIRRDGETLEQIDGAVHADGLHCLIESKDTDGAVNLEPIAKLRNQLLRRHCSVVGCVFSRRGFTQPASTLAQFVGPQLILLWTGPEISYVLERGAFIRALRRKYRVAIEYATPDHDVTTEDFR